MTTIPISITISTPLAAQSEVGRQDRLGVRSSRSGAGVDAPMLGVDLPQLPLLSGCLISPALASNERPQQVHSDWLKQTSSDRSSCNAPLTARDGRHLASTSDAHQG
eukprot:9197889-Alexandrium_andersonii.AAC.1